MERCEWCKDFKRRKEGRKGAGALGDPKAAELLVRALRSVQRQLTRLDILYSNAINRAIQVLTDRGLPPSEVRSGMKELSLYTNAESCPMCASAIRWGGLKEYVFGTSISQLVA